MAAAENRWSPIRIGHTLSKEEEHHVFRRRSEVQQCLARHGIHCDADKVPTIALMGSGGGQRAMVGLLACLQELGEVDLLDSMMYLAGTSGSTWAMAAVYKYNNWSRVNRAHVFWEIAERLRHGYVTWWHRWYKYFSYKNVWDHESLTQKFASFVVTTYVKQVDERTLPMDRGRFRMDPYPIYTVMDQEFGKENHPQLKNAWVEMTPHYSGYSLTGAFVDQRFFGHKFWDSEVELMQGEMDMLYVQGLCGSALAGSSRQHGVWSTLMEVAERVFSPKGCSCLGCEVLKSLIELNLQAPKGDYNPADGMNKLLEGKLDKTGKPFLINPDNALMDKSVQMENLKVYTLSVCDCFPDWSEGCRVAPDEWDFMTRAIKGDFTWGDTYNFLAGMGGNSVAEVHPNILRSEIRNYVDAGILHNSPYFSVLRKERKIDLIISLDFSAGDAVLTIKQAHQMAKHMGIPFPHVEVGKEDEDAPKNFYVFPGDRSCPTVIHMPLFNLTNCGGPALIKWWREQYPTVHWDGDNHSPSYSAEDITDLYHISALNITHVKRRLLEEIRKVVQQKMS